MAAIRKTLNECCIEHPEFYEDEVDIISAPKSVLTGSSVDNKNASPHPVRMRNTTLRNRCTAVQAKSATWEATVKSHLCLSACLSI